LSRDTKAKGYNVPLHNRLPDNSLPTQRVAKAVIECAFPMGDLLPIASLRRLTPDDRS
jgi:hypothetical protein